MERKQIQEQRMKGYFIDAAKELLKGEGLTAINVRNVAEKAGYSYATMYNYFKDLNDLVFECVRDFQVECAAMIERETGEAAPGKERIKATVSAYVRYFTDYPGIFELFFIEKMGSACSKRETAELIYTFLDRLCEPHWKYCIANGLYDSPSVETKTRQLRFIIMGMLLFYQNRLQPDNYKDFIAMLNEQVAAIVV